ncbi:MAG: glycosyl transferase [Alphaproteobacteria bacterium]|nr:glycosyl transferase [Alphaproteobacteria bacterium]
MSARVFIWVQHLLGFGHFARARVVAEALRDDGFAVTLVSGGVTPADAVPNGISFVQLPPTRAKDELFDELVDAQGRDVDKRWHEARRDHLLAAFRAARPDVLITETFPFGRRLLEFELMALLDEAKRPSPAPKIVSSVRDVLQRPRKDVRAAGMVERARAIYDAVIVHGDPAVLRVGQSFPEMDGIAAKCIYTGYICADMPKRTSIRREVLVSAGGGAAGQSLIAAAVEARLHCRPSDAPWTFVTGPLTAMPVPVEGVTMVRSLSDFRARLANAAVSISQAGYNTMIETVKARTPAIVVPFETDREQEQVIRARAFADLGLVRLLRGKALEPRVLARLVDATIGSVPPTAKIDFDGGAGTVRAINAVLGR